jgi:hypothetical protein
VTGKAPTINEFHVIVGIAVTHRLFQLRSDRDGESLIWIAAVDVLADAMENWRTELEDQAYRLWSHYDSQYDHHAPRKARWEKGAAGFQQERRLFLNDLDDQRLKAVFYDYHLLVRPIDYVIYTAADVPNYDGRLSVASTTRLESPDLGLKDPLCTRTIVSARGPDA